MAKKRKLVWQLFPSYLYLIIFVLLVVIFFSFRSIESLFFDKVKDELKTNSYLVEDLIKEDLLLAKYDELQSSCQRLGLQTSFRLTVVLATGEVVCDSDTNPKDMENHAFRPEIKSALTGHEEAGRHFSPTLNQDMIYFAKPLNYNNNIQAVLRFAVSVNSLDTTLASIRYELIVVGVLTAIIAAFLNLINARYISQPIEKIKQAILFYQTGDLGYQLPPFQTEEFDELFLALRKIVLAFNERIQEEAKKKQSLTEILSNFIDGIVVCDTNGRLFYMNEPAKQILGLVDEKNTHSYFSRYIQNESLKSFVEEFLQKEELVEQEFVVDDNVGQINLRCLPFFDSNQDSVGRMLVLRKVITS